MATVRKANNKTSQDYIIDYTDPYTGKRRRKTFKGELREAEAIAKELELKRYRVKNGIETAIRSNIRLDELIRKYEYSIKKLKNPKTVKREILSLDSFLGHLGTRMLNTIQSGDIQDYVEVRLDSGLSPHTVNLDLRNLRILFNYAVKNLFLVRNPISGVTWPKAPRKQVRFLSKFEIDRLLQVMDDTDFKDIVVTYLNTGARRDEILPPGFTWENVDFENNQIRLLGKRDIIRWIPISEPLKEIFMKRKDGGQAIPFNYTPDQVSYRLGEYYKKANIKNANVHVLRKTFGSILIQNKIADIYVVSKLLGHSSVRVTETHYVGLLKENIQEPIDNLAQFLIKKKPT